MTFFVILNFCLTTESYGTVMVIAAIFIILYSIGFPAYCVWLIRENKPYGSREDPEKCYDEEGNLVEYTDDRYVRPTRSSCYVIPLTKV